MSTPFSRSGKRKLGYNVSQVDEFLAEARQQYNNISNSTLTAEDIRTVRFQLQKNGYSISVVDAALEKLEDVFASHEYGQQVVSKGYFEYTEDLEHLKVLIIERTRRKKRRKFVKRGWPNRGYSVKQVDRFCSQLGNKIEAEAKLTVREVRTATFKPKRGGYAEYQVDAFLEKVVEYLQRSEALKKISR